MKIDAYSISTLTLEHKNYINSLIEDVDDINRITGRNIYIDYQDFHNEYSPERTDPCPDYYGMFSLKDENGETVGDFGNLSDLDSLIFAIHCFVNYEKR